MNHIKKLTLLIFFALSVLLISCGTSKSATEKDNRAKLLHKQIENLDFKFIANYANPQNYRSIYLSSLYNVTVSPDTIKAYLPYYGRAYRAPMNPSEGGIKFESVDFESNIQIGKKYGEWHVTIKTKDTSRPFTLYFHLWNNGAAQLIVNDQERQSISFRGILEE